MKTSRLAFGNGSGRNSAVHQAEDRGVGADADGEDEDGDERRSRVAAQRAEGVAQVVQERCPSEELPGVAVEEARGLDAAQCQHGLAPRLFGAQAAPAMVFGGHLQMARQLLFEIAIEAVAANERGDFRGCCPDGAEEARQAGSGAWHGHGQFEPSGCAPRMRPITADSRSHVEVCSAR